MTPRGAARGIPGPLSGFTRGLLGLQQMIATLTASAQGRRAEEREERRWLEGRAERAIAREERAGVFEWQKKEAEKGWEFKAAEALRRKGYEESRLNLEKIRTDAAALTSQLQADVARLSLKTAPTAEEAKELRTLQRQESQARTAESNARTEANKIKRDQEIRAETDARQRERMIREAMKGAYDAKYKASLAEGESEASARAAADVAAGNEVTRLSQWPLGALRGRISTLRGKVAAPGATAAKESFSERVERGLIREPGRAWRDLPGGGILEPLGKLSGWIGSLYAPALEEGPIAKVGKAEPEVEFWRARGGVGQPFMYGGPKVFFPREGKE